MQDASPHTAIALAEGKANLAAITPYAALICAMAVFTCGSSFAKSLFPIVGAEGVSAYRVGFSALLLCLVFRPWRTRLTRDDILRVASFGAVLGLMNFTFYLSLRTLPLGIAVAIEFMGPLSLSLALSRRPIHFVAIALAVLGLALLLPIWSQGAALDPAGVAFAAAAGVFWALYIILGKRTRHLPGGQAVALGMSTAALLVVPIGVVSAGSALLRPELILGGLIVATLSSAIPYSLEMVAMRRIPSRNFGVMLSLEPAIGALSGLIILGEALTLAQWVAILLVVAASGLAVGFEPKQTVEPAP